jgi:hypothetical protein
VWRHRAYLALWAALHVILATTWVVYALAAENFTRSKWDPDADDDAAGHDLSGQCYLVISVWFIVYTILLKSMDWISHWVDISATAPVLTWFSVAVIFIYGLALIAAAVIVAVYILVLYDTTSSAPWVWGVTGSWLLVLLTTVIVVLYYIHLWAAYGKSPIGKRKAALAAEEASLLGDERSRR